MVSFKKVKPSLHSIQLLFISSPWAKHDLQLLKQALIEFDIFSLRSKFCRVVGGWPSIWVVWGTTSIWVVCYLASIVVGSISIWVVGCLASIVVGSTSTWVVGGSASIWVVGKFSSRISIHWKSLAFVPFGHWR